MDFAYGGELVLRGVDRKGAINDFPDELDRAREFGTRIVYG
jgi:hypothetical protein